VLRASRNETLLSTSEQKTIFHSQNVQSMEWQQMEKNLFKSFASFSSAGRQAGVYLKLIIDMKGTCKRQPLCQPENDSGAEEREVLDYTKKSGSKIFLLLPVIFLVMVALYICKTGTKLCIKIYFSST